MDLVSGEEYSFIVENYDGFWKSNFNSQKWLFQKKKITSRKIAIFLKKVNFQNNVTFFKKHVKI